MNGPFQPRDRRTAIGGGQSPSTRQFLLKLTDVVAEGARAVEGVGPVAEENPGWITESASQVVHRGVEGAAQLRFSRIGPER